jgi:hypothetical protein
VVASLGKFTEEDLSAGWNDLEAMLEGRNYSSDSRGDCKQVCIGLVCTPEGLPLNYEVFAGNRTNVTAVEARLVEHPDGDGKERFVLCRSNARAAKEQAMLERLMNRLSDELIQVDRSLRKRPGQDEGKIERRIGRWLGKYPVAAKWIQAELVHGRRRASQTRRTHRESAPAHCCQACPGRGSFACSSWPSLTQRNKACSKCSGEK